MYCIICLNQPNFVNFIPSALFFLHTPHCVTATQRCRTPHYVVDAYTVTSLSHRRGEHNIRTQCISHLRYLYAKYSPNITDLHLPTLAWYFLIHAVNYHITIKPSISKLEHTNTIIAFFTSLYNCTRFSGFDYIYYGNSNYNSTIGLLRTHKHTSITSQHRNMQQHKTGNNRRHTFMQGLYIKPEI